MTPWLPTKDQGFSIKCPVEHLSFLTRDKGSGFQGFVGNIGVQPDYDRVVTSMMNSLKPSMIWGADNMLGHKNVIFDYPIRLVDKCNRAAIKLHKMDCQNLCLHSIKRFAS